MNQIKNSGHKYFKIFFVIFIAFFILIFGSAIFFGTPIGQIPLGIVTLNKIYSQGTRSGQIVKFTEKGVVWKTLEGTLALTQSGAYIGEWNFSVDPKGPDRQKNVDLIYRAMDSGNIVKIDYVQIYGKLPWRGDTSYFVKNIEILGKGTLINLPE